MIIKVENINDVVEFKKIIRRINLMDVNRLCRFMMESMMQIDTSDEFIIDSSVLYLELDDDGFKEKWDLYWSNYEENGFFN